MAGALLTWGEDMKVLHTADIHLREYQDERWGALQELIKVGKNNNVDIFAISGDLFDKGVDAENLRPQIREVFSNTGFRVLIIPGNHDSESYKSGMYFGEDVLILDGSPVEYGDVCIVGIPFETIYGEELIRKIKNVTEVFGLNAKNILLCHGELLDAYFSRSDFGAEGKERYMPFKLSYFDEVNVNYVLAGHFHSKFEVWQLKNGGYFIYPGSPISITKRELGQRKVNIFEIGKPPSGLALDTPHYEQVIIELDPFSNDDPVEIVKQNLKALHPKAIATLTVKGYINSEIIQISEADIIAHIKEIASDKCEDECYEFKDISRILENDLFKSYSEKIRDAGYEEEKIKQLYDIAIRAMIRAEL